MLINNLVVSAKDHRRVWALAGPMILSGVSTPLLGMVDTAVMGHLPDARFLGAVAVGAMVIHFLFWAFGFLRMGTTGLTAQAHGRNDGDELRAVLGRALVLASGFGGLLVLFQWPLSELAFALVQPSAQVEAEARVYYSIRVWAAPAALANYALWGWFLGAQNARAPLLIMLSINGVNIALDLLLVVGLGMQTEGVAWGSLLAEYTGLVLGLFLVRRELSAYAGRWVLRRVLARASLVHMLRLNYDIFLRTLGLMFAFAFFTTQGARLGDATLAANAVLMNFQTFMAYGLDGFAHAAEALVGRSIGARDPRGLRRGILATGLWSLVTALGFTGVYVVAGQSVIALLTDLESVRATAATYLPWLMLTPLVSVWAYWLDGIAIGATRAAAMRNAMLIAVFLIYLPSWYLLRPLGNHGLWLALMLFMAARGATLGWWLWRVGGSRGLVRSEE